MYLFKKVSRYVFVREGYRFDLFLRFFLLYIEYGSDGAALLVFHLMIYRYHGNAKM